MLNEQGQSKKIKILPWVGELDENSEQIASNSIKIYWKLNTAACGT